MSETKKRNIFLSIGKQYHPRYKEFALALKAVLNEHDMVVYELPGRTFEDPLGEIAAMLKVCDGAIVVCFERIFGTQARECRTGDEPTTIKPLNTTTVWNHMEGAMAASAGLPVLILAENGCRDEGILGTNVRQNVIWMEMTPEALKSIEFTSMFAGWKKKALVTPAALKPDAALQIDSLKDRPVVEIFRSFRLRHWAAIGAYTAGAFGLGAWVSTFFPGMSS
jgi:hypothetical protein